MHVASLELCKELYELSEWGKTEWAYGKWTPEDKKPFMAEYNYGEFGHDAFRVAPAYDLGYLLRKLRAIDDPDNGEPKNIYVELTVLENYSNATAVRGITDVGINQPRQRQLPSCEADTPEDALCKLAIELFKQEILERSSNDR